MTLSLPVVLFSVSLLSPLLSAQVDNKDFDRYSIDDGLSNGYVNSVFQDSRGFVWVGTENGLNRFDGISFKAYYFDFKDSTSVPGNDVGRMVEDTVGRIWIMTNNNFCYYDRNTDSFVRKRLRLNGVEISNLNLLNCMIDGRGYLWMGSSTGIFRIKVYNNPDLSGNIIDCDEYLLDEPDVDFRFKNVYSSFVEDKSGKVWAVSYSKDLFYFDPKANKFLPYRLDLPEAAIFSNANKNFIIGRDGNFYIVVEQAGLVIWRRSENEFKLYKPDGTDKGPHGNILFAIAEDNDGLIWLGDRNTDGVSIFNKSTGKFAWIRSEEANPYTLNTNKITSFFQSKTGSMWVGTIVGINKYTPGKIKFKRYFSITGRKDKLNFNNTLCFAESSTGDIWIGTDGGGLNKYNPKTGLFTHYVHNSELKNSLSSDAVVSLFEDHEGALWIGTFDGGLVKFKDEKFTTFMPDLNNPYSISDRNVWFILEDSRKNLWIATLNAGLSLFDRKTGRFYNYSHMDGDSTSLCNNSLISLYEDSKNNLYAASYNGVSVINLESVNLSEFAPKLKFRNLFHKEAKNSLSSNAIFSVMEDHKGNLWFGSNGSGMDKLDVKTGRFSNYSIMDGLPGNFVHSILVDDNSILWLGTDKGLVMFNPESKEITVFDNEDGLLNKSLKSWAIKTKSGEMFFGGLYGFNSFFPQKIKFKQNTSKPIVVLSGFRIFNKPVKIGEEINGQVILSKDISVTNEIKMNHNDNFFTIEFIALDYTAPKKNSYSYKMDGFDLDWINCGTRHEANYTNLDPGTYTFRVKASNNDGVWSDTDSFLKIVILPPWWLTLWFKTAVIVFILLVFALILISRERKLKEQKMLLEKTVAIKTNELKEMNASKDRFFSIIAHDLKNPFNTIIGFSELMKDSDQNTEKSQYLKLSEQIHSSAVQTFRLLENLLEWANSQQRKVIFNPVSTNLYELIEEEFFMVHEMAGGKNIRLQNNINRQLNITADRNMLKTILRNLITNGVKFTNRDGEVQVTARPYDNFIEIAVSDTGIGMTNETMSKLFRIDGDHSTAGTENERGTGLGLFLCKEFVEKHGGKIWTESILGKGAAFKFIIPAPINGNESLNQS
jgi:signal transduction histidine kinase/ligand-binding sensor domain-containing protein